MKYFWQELTTKDNSSKSHLHLNKIPYAQQKREMTLGNCSNKAEIRHSEGYIDTVNCYSGVVTKTWNLHAKFNSDLSQNLVNEQAARLNTS